MDAAKRKIGGDLKRHPQRIEAGDQVAAENVAFIEGPVPRIAIDRLLPDPGE